MKGKHLKKLEIIEALKDMTKDIKLFFNFLMTIVQLPLNHRIRAAFPAAGLFITEMRTRLSDRIIDHLCF